MAAVSTRIFDHIVHLTLPGQLQKTTETWRDLGFNVISGGTHADGLTENALVAFEDGAYIELISFTHPLSYYPPNTPTHHARKHHAWASKQPGFIDFAFLGNAGYPSIAAVINARAEQEGSGVEYAGEVPGGRTRTDGQVLQWLISAPIQHAESGDVRGKLPFFCGDLTPRDLRVPHESHENTHPNTALGISHIHLLASQDEIRRISKQITTVIGFGPFSDQSSSASSSHPGSHTRDRDQPSECAVRWDLDSVHHGSSDYTAVLELSAPRNKQEEMWLRERGAGLYRVRAHVKEATAYAKEYETNDSRTREVELIRRL